MTELGVATPRGGWNIGLSRLFQKSIEPTENGWLFADRRIRLSWRRYLPGRRVVAVTTPGALS